MMRLVMNVTLGAIAGLVATIVMGQVTSWLMQVQPESTTEREQEVSSESPMRVLARRGLRFTPAVDEQAHDPSQIAQRIHWTYGTIWGSLYGVLAMVASPLVKAAGLPFGFLVWFTGDIVLATVLKLTPPPQRFPVLTHVRGILGHLVFGLTTAMMFRGLVASRPRQD